jgi:hypothetical protein
MIVRAVPCLTKFAVLLGILGLPLSWTTTILLCLFVTWAYQYLIAFIFGVHAMPSMDSACFLGKDTSRINFISVTTIDKYEYALARARSKEFLRQKPKLRYQIAEIFGDYYWKDTQDIERALDKCMQKVPKEI